MSGVISRGVRAPIIREGDDIVAVVVESVENAMREDGFELHDRDVVAVTESVVARHAANCFCHLTKDNQRRSFLQRFFPTCLRFD